jgi:chitinase
MRLYITKIILLTAFLSSMQAVAATTHNSNLAYNNTDFNQLQPGWANTLTLYNLSSKPMVMTQLQFETNYNSLDTSQLNGTIYHSQTPATPKKISEFDYSYAFSTESPYSKGTFTIIPANGSVTLTQIPLAHEQTSVNGIPLYYRLPFNIKVTLQDGTQLDADLKDTCQHSQCNDPASGKIIGAYYTDWANYHYSQTPKNMLMPNQTPIQQVNTIFYDVGKIDNKTAAIQLVDINHDQYYLPAFDTLKQQYPYINLVYSFGGWGDAASMSYPSYDLAAIFDQQNPKLIQTLADNMVNTILSLGFNGIDIDYEWIAIQPGTSQPMQLTRERALGYQQLLQDIRDDFNKIQPQDQPNYYKLTTAVFAGTDKVDEFVAKGGDWSKIASAVDAIDIMTYDMHGQFDLSQLPPDNITDFHSQMQTEHQYQSEMLNHYNIMDAVDSYEKSGVPAKKIVIGLPAYTRIEKTLLPVSDDNKGLYLTLSTDQPLGESGSGGTTDYKCILDNSYCWNGFNFTSLTYIPAILSGEGLGSLAKTPWAYDKSLNWFMSFDDGSSAKYKAHWAKQNNLGGVMIWELDGDIPMSDKNYQQNSIIYNSWLGLVN